MTHTFEKNGQNVKALSEYLIKTNRKHFKLNNGVKESTKLTMGKMVDAIRTLERQGALKKIGEPSGKKTYLVDYNKLGGT